MCLSCPLPFLQDFPCVSLSLYQSNSLCGVSDPFTPFPVPFAEQNGVSTINQGTSQLLSGGSGLRCGGGDKK